jgi:hypothetical protein
MVAPTLVGRVRRAQLGRREHHARRDLHGQLECGTGRLPRGQQHGAHDGTLVANTLADGTRVESGGFTLHHQYGDGATQPEQLGHLEW